MPCSESLNSLIGRVAICLAIALMTCKVTPGQTVRAKQQKYLFYVGTYADRDNKGIYAYRFDSKNGRASALNFTAESAELSFLAIAPGGRFLYATNNIFKPSGTLNSFAIEPETGKLSLLNQVGSHDEGPVHIALDRSGKYALVSNYTQGSVAVFPVLDDGRLATASAFVQHKGSSVNPERQKGPHAHAAVFSPDNRFAIVADLGLDQILAYPFDDTKGTLGSNPQIVNAPSGAGPRHLAFDSKGKFLYVINELQSVIVTYSYDAQLGELREVQTISTLPKGLKSNNTAAEIEIHPSGRFVLASNRGSDTIAIFAVDPKNGTLKLVEIDSAGGKTPRSFALDPTGYWLLVGDEGSNKIVIFHMNPVTGHLSQTERVLPISSPVCIKFVPDL
jgi:6-phosphogluconolactonase